ncbi:MAG TPA: aquaporin [Candidatus Krumholzibacteria bacterium]|nr:aquaporin [Candidatus Krumholzibacteria bacterium]
MSKLIAEFFGTFTLIFIGVGAIAADHASGGALGLTGIALAHGLAIAVMVSATAATSGGHLNPAVTCGALVAGKIRPGMALSYIVAQCLGAVFAAFMVKLSVPSDWLTAVGMGTPALGQGVSVGQALVMEAVLTFFLMFVVYGTAVDARAPKVAGLFIGLTIAMGIMASGPVSGGAINPARHFGPALMGGGMQNIWLYWVGPILGSVVAALIYKNTIEGK